MDKSLNQLFEELVYPKVIINAYSERNEITSTELTLDPASGKFVFSNSSNGSGEYETSHYYEAIIYCQKEKDSVWVVSQK